jgi:hypothetical protein
MRVYIYVCHIIIMVWCLGMYKLLGHVLVLVTYGFYKKIVYIPEKIMSIKGLCLDFITGFAKVGTRVFVPVPDICPCIFFLN